MENTETIVAKALSAVAPWTAINILKALHQVHMATKVLLKTNSSAEGEYRVKQEVHPVNFQYTFTRDQYTMVVTKGTDRFCQPMQLQTVDIPVLAFKDQQ